MDERLRKLSEQFKEFADDLAQEDGDIRYEAPEYGKCAACAGLTRGYHCPDCLRLVAETLSAQDGGRDALKLFCAAMDGRWEVVSHGVNEPGQPTVTYRSLVVSTVEWTHRPFHPEMIPQVGTKGRIGFIGQCPTPESKDKGDGLT